MKKLLAFLIKLRIAYIVHANRLFPSCVEKRAEKALRDMHPVHNVFSVFYAIFIGQMNGSDLSKHVEHAKRLLDAPGLKHFIEPDRRFMEAYIGLKFHHAFEHNIFITRTVRDAIKDVKSSERSELFKSLFIIRLPDEYEKAVEEMKLSDKL